MIHNEGLFKLGLLVGFVWEQGIPKFHGESPRSLGFNGNLGLNHQFSEQTRLLWCWFFIPLHSHCIPWKKWLNQLNPYISQGIPMNTLWNSHVLWPNHMKSTLHPSLVGGWALPLWKMMEFVSWDDDIPNIWKKCSTPPTRLPLKSRSMVESSDLPQIATKLLFDDGRLPLGHSKGEPAGHPRAP